MCAPDAISETESGGLVTWIAVVKQRPKNLTLFIPHSMRAY